MTNSHAKQQIDSTDATTRPANDPSSENPFDSPIDEFPHETESGRKRGTINNLKHLIAGYGIGVSYDELLKEQTIRLNNTLDAGHGDLIANSNVAHIRSIMALNGLPMSCFELLSAIFAEHTKNPILNFIQSVPWDWRDRLETLAKTLTVIPTDEDYTKLALRTWLIQCVAAADGAKSSKNPQALAKFELIFILQGGQGVKKTSWFRHLLPKELGKYIVDGAHLDPADNETVRIARANRQ